MKLFKLDLMTILIIVVAIGVAVTMTTQASDRSAEGLSMSQALSQIQVSAQKNRLNR